MTMKNTLRQMRRQRGLTQEALSQMSGVSRATIVALETNVETVVLSSTLEALAFALDCEVGDIFFTSTA